MRTKPRPIPILLAIFLASILSLGFLTAPAQAVTLPATTVSLSATSTVAQNGSATLAGTVRYASTKKVIYNASVVIQRKTGTSWTNVATVKTNTSGVFKYVAKYLTKDVVYRAAVLRTTRYASSVSASRTVVVRQIISLTSTGPKTFTSGTKITVAGSVTPGLYYKSLSLQKYTNGSWATTKTFLTTSTGKFSVTLPIYGAGGGQKLRVVGRNAPAPTWTINVYAWYYLSQLESVSSSRFSDDLTVMLRGKTYPNSLQFDEPWIGDAKGHVTYNLGYKCTKFESQVGTDDRAPGSLSAWRYIVTRDEVQTSTGYISLGSDIKLTANLQSVLRLTLSSFKELTGYDSSAHEGEASWGSPRILCLGKP